MIFFERIRCAVALLLGMFLLCCAASAAEETSIQGGAGALGKTENTASLNAAVNQLLAEDSGSSDAASSPAQDAKNSQPAPLQSPSQPSQVVGVMGTSTKQDGDLSQEAFLNAAQTLMPMSPDQIKALRYLFDQSQQAAARYPGTAPRPTSSSVVVNLAPGSTPPMVRLRAGFVTSIDFLDSTGAAWPISAFDLGNPSDFNVQWDHHGNTLLLQATSTYKSGNLAVMLQGFDTPVMITLMPGQANVDYRVDLRVPGFGPNAEPDVTGLPSVANVKLVDFLDGVPAEAAEALQLENVPEGMAWLWLYQGKLYLRTRMTLLSPGWLSSMSSPDGMHVYELSKVSVLLISDHGKVQQIKVSGL